uniref:Tumor necrosis factor receptor superfamily member 9-like n=1 Tax=Poecilia reticulata TaxID=8081 RepID=A0A3P9N6D2_POERE
AGNHSCWCLICDFACVDFFAGNRLVKPSGTNPQQLCTPCEDGTYTYQSLGYRCSSCIQCVGALVHFKDCTPKSNTQCRCKEGLRCGDAGCTFCVDECGKGEEPTKKRMYICKYWVVTIEKGNSEMGGRKKPSGL